MDVTLNVRVEDVFDFLENLIQEATINVASYEDFDGDVFQMADFRKMDSWDSFLYGIALGKKDQLEYLYALLEQKMRQIS